MIESGRSPLPVTFDKHWQPSSWNDCDFNRTSEFFRVLTAYNACLTTNRDLNLAIYAFLPFPELATTAGRNPIGSRPSPATAADAQPH